MANVVRRNAGDDTPRIASRGKVGPVEESMESLIE